LADALAVSAAFPGGFGPLAVKTAQFCFSRRQWNAPLGTEQPVEVHHKTLHLYDGGVYDNLGLEPFFDAGRGVSKHPESFIIVSDAGSPLPEGFSFRRFNPLRLMRIADIMSNQAHALRVRTFTNFLQQDPNRGVLFFINTPVCDSPVEDTSGFAATFPTTLRRLTADQFDRLADHGYRVALKVEREYGLKVIG
jgi:NTE family protein